MNLYSDEKNTASVECFLEEGVKEASFLFRINGKEIELSYFRG